MYILLLKFEIPTNKLYEFDLAIGRLVKWPVYSLYASSKELNKKSFEFSKDWTNEEDLKNDLKGQIFLNLLGLVKVLGSIQHYEIYKADITTNEFQSNDI